MGDENPNKWDFDNENGDDPFDDDMADKSIKHRRDCTVFLVDARSSMVHGGFLSKCLEAARNTLKSRIISSDRDQLGLCLFGTEKKKNQMDFANIATLLDLDEPTPQSIQLLDEYVTNKRDIEFGSSNLDWSQGFPLHEALWVCQQMFSDSSVPKDSTRRVFVLTNDDNPVGSSRVLRDRALQKAQDMKQAGYEIVLFPFHSASKPFSTRLLWQDVRTEIDDELVDMDDLLAVVRKKVFQKRALCNLRWGIGPGIELSVSVYSVVSVTRPTQPKYLDASHNPLVSRAKYFGSMTANNVNPDQIRRSFNFGGETIDFSAADLKAIKDPGPVGLTLFGFKDRRRLKDYHNIKHSYFIFPTEKPIAGSSKAFFALHRQMIRKKKYALCKLVRTTNSAPRLVALVPSEKTLTPDGESVLSFAGMHLVILPWADDIRDIPLPLPLKGLSADQQEAADRLAETLTMRHFSSDLFPNPALQKYYVCLQAMALGQSAFEDIKDDIVPNEAALKHAQPEIEHFRQTFFGDNYGDALASVKASASRSTSTPRAPKPSLGVDGQYEWSKLAANGQLAALTLPDLKSFLKDHGLKVSGKKEELIVRIENHLAGGSVV
eukprot:c11089_g2_i1.p1 GENE.c11089_g2_i1~~c11089_g2_i1.p1  ORF type:complete len:605 (+),score=172.79 c11089_g2_i1:577-2391(+)